MEHQQDKRKRSENKAATTRDKERRKNERRKNECGGYAYIEMVGWMDRRECVRRDDDDYSD